MMKKMKTEFQNNGDKKAISIILKHWERNLAVNIDLSKECISSSWKYEYQIFELTSVKKYRLGQKSCCFTAIKMLFLKIIYR